MNTKEYWQKVAAEVGLPEDQAKIAEALFANEKVANHFVPRPVFSSELDKANEKYNGLVQQNESYYKTEAQRAAENQKKVDETLGREQRYRDLYGELPSDGSPAPHKSTFDASQYISAEDHKKAMAQLENQTLYVIEKGLECSNDYRDRFGKSLNIGALKDYAVKNQLPIDLAYQRMIQPEVEEKSNSDWSAKLKAAREEGAQEALSRVKTPLDTAPRESSPFLSNVLRPQPKDAQPLSTSERLRNFAEAYTAPANPTKS